MPIYEYLCSECNETFEKMVRFSESEHNPACPKCKSEDTHKKLSIVASLKASSSGSISSTRSSCGSRGGFR